MTISQTVINERCNRWLADILERRGVANPHELAEHVTTELLAQGLAPVPRPFPLRPTAPVASEEARQKAKDAAAEAVAAAKAKRTRVGPPPTPSVEDLVAVGALLGLNQDDLTTAIEQLDLATAPTTTTTRLCGRTDSGPSCAALDCETDGCELATRDAGLLVTPALQLDEPVFDTWGPDDPPF